MGATVTPPGVWCQRQYRSTVSYQPGTSESGRAARLPGSRGGFGRRLQFLPHCRAASAAIFIQICLAEWRRWSLLTNNESNSSC